ncbi:MULTISPECIES: type II toxin-antitoxin system RelE/ParE family toxin [unclassified Phenylobacterium]|jgi:phage-related protein|uniref:type II toxin-antitoxin system RelE/ParE family toxin n=1 Tax=unclassified Phenylobacterium TaxID=2640670 RepID=UPI00083A019E|nr:MULTISPECIES: type II toxin-antitoxin system RelE/ParE family toxin [unclassified Phenylobacterium]
MDEREIDWRGSTYKDLLEMPAKVRQTFGFALGLAQNNLPYEDAKTLSGFKPALVEILEDDDGDTYRAVYTAHFEDVVYVLHCFKKKSTKGRSLPSRDKETIEARLAEVKKIESEKAKLKKRGS